MMQYSCFPSQTDKHGQYQKNPTTHNALLPKSTSQTMTHIDSTCSVVSSAWNLKTMNLIKDMGSYCLRHLKLRPLVRDEVL